MPTMTFPSPFLFLGMESVNKVNGTQVLGKICESNGAQNQNKRTIFLTSSL